MKSVLDCRLLWTGTPDFEQPGPLSTEVLAQVTGVILGAWSLTSEFSSWAVLDPCRTRGAPFFETALFFEAIPLDFINVLIEVTPHLRRPTPKVPRSMHHHSLDPPLDVPREPWACSHHRGALEARPARGLVGRPH